MIWSITSRDEYEHYGISSVFKHYREALGKENIQLAVVDETDNLDFVAKDDIVLLRTASESLINTIRKKKVRTTSEDYDTYELVKDKAKLAIFLLDNGIRVPRQYHQDFALRYGNTYFVKPRYGSDSIGITELNICHNVEEIRLQCDRLDPNKKGDAIIEDFIEGTDCTVTCINNCTTNELLVCPISIECDETGSIQTRQCKVEFKECCSALDNEEIKRIATYAFRCLKLKSHARIDFRKGVDGHFYVIDINLLPGLGPLDHLAKSLLLTKNMSYIDALKAVIASAS